jgi:uncharacterized protein YbjT (DUF2867 family)
MPKRILVTGGTGTLGRLVVGRLVAGGPEVRVLSRGATGVPGAELVSGDLRTGRGVAAAVSGTDAIVHCASATTGDEATTRTLVTAAAAAARAHLVFISIVGIDAVNMGYYRTKRAAERVVTSSGLPWTILRATQFFDLLLRGARPLSRLPVVPVPAGFVCQPVDADEVAQCLVQLVLGEPAGRVADLAGPQVLSFADVIHQYLRATHHRRPVVAVPLPGLRAVRAGGLLPQGQVDTGRRTWAQFLTGDSAE